jgi:hypothetical protein
MITMATNTFCRDYEQGGDFSNPRTGEGIGYIKSIVPNPSGFTSLTGSIKADNYRGKRVRLSAFVKSEDVKGWAGLWMRIDGPNGKQLGFDNMQHRPIKGTSDWKKHEVVLDVPEDSIKIWYGVILNEEGQVWVGDLLLICWLKWRTKLCPRLTWIHQEPVKSIWRYPVFGFRSGKLTNKRDQ